MKSQWPMVKLNEACSLNMGQSPDSSGYNDEGRGIPFYQGNADFGALTPVTRFYCDNPTKIAHRGDILLLPQFNTCSSSGVFDRLLVKKSFDLLRLFLNASHMGFCMFFKLSIPFCRRSFGKGRFQIPVQ